MCGGPSGRGGDHKAERAGTKMGPAWKFETNGRRP